MRFWKTVKPVWVDTHMTSMKIIQFSKPPTPLVHLHPKFSHLLDLGRPLSNEPPPSPMITNQFKENIPRMTVICYQVLPSGRLSFSVSTH